MRVYLSLLIFLNLFGLVSMMTQGLQLYVSEGDKSAIRGLQTWLDAFNAADPEAYRTFLEEQGIPNRSIGYTRNEGQAEKLVQNIALCPIVEPRPEVVVLLRGICCGLRRHCRTYSAQQAKYRTVDNPLKWMSGTIAPMPMGFLTKRLMEADVLGMSGAHWE